MKLIIPTIIFLIVLGCTEQQPEFKSVIITPIFKDSLSIRALQPIDENSLWFAANRGVVGFLDGQTPKLATIKYEDTLLQFRAIAKTNEAVFVLSIGDPGILYKIDFNGKEATNIKDVYVETGKGVFYDAIKFWNEKEGIALGDPIGGCLSIIITRDGGNSWEKLNCNQLPPVIEGEAAFAASNTNIATYKNHTWIATGGKSARVFYSPNKGKTWEVYNTPIIQGKEMTGIYSIAFYDENIGVIFGGDWKQKHYNEGNKAITTNGGKTWNLIANGEAPGYRSCVAFVPQSEGNEIVAVGSPGISYSANKGKKWKELSSEGFYSIVFINDSVAFASGQNKISKLLFKR